MNSFVKYNYIYSSTDVEQAVDKLLSFAKRVRHSAILTQAEIIDVLNPNITMLQSYDWTMYHKLIELGILVEMKTYPFHFVFRPFYSAKKWIV